MVSTIHFQSPHNLNLLIWSLAYYCLFKTKITTVLALRNKTNRIQVSENDSYLVLLCRGSFHYPQLGRVTQNRSPVYLSNENLNYQADYLSNTSCLLLDTLVCNIAQKKAGNLGKKNEDWHFTEHHQQRCTFSDIRKRMQCVNNTQGSHTSQRADIPEL